MGKSVSNGSDVSTYLNGTVVNNQRATMQVVNIRNNTTNLTAGAVASGTTRNLRAITTSAERVSHSPGSYKVNIPPDVNPVYKDRVESIPSGYNADGTPNWSSGKIARSTTWAADHEVTNGGEFTYLNNGALPVNKVYRNLAT